MRAAPPRRAAYESTLLPGEPLVTDPGTGRTITMTEYREEFYSGPLPSAQELAAYNMVSPSLADTIVTEWRTESAHRRRLESTALTSTFRAHTRGQILGFTIAIVVIACGMALIFTGRSTAGLVTILVPIAGLAAVFAVDALWGKSPRARGS